MQNIKTIMSGQTCLENLSDREIAHKQAEKLNRTPGDLQDGFDCPACNNKGYTFTEYGDGENWSVISMPCMCLNKRVSLRRLKNSGLQHTIEACKFDNYIDTETWQTHLKEGVKKFADEVPNLHNRWLYVGGGIGCGKTHLCTAAAGQLLEMGYDIKYMLWVDESAKLKANANKPDIYAELMEPIKSAQVLYIDDLFKIEPTPADIKLAYEIINYRYQNPTLITIISSEKYISEINAIDSAIGSRIYEKAKGNTYNVKRDESRNYRVKDMAVI